MADKPTEITSENWEEKKSQGFKWTRNVDSWHENRISLGEWLNKQEEIHGEGSVLVGWPADMQGNPDDSIPGANNMVGIYVKQEGSSLEH